MFRNLSLESIDDSLKGFILANGDSRAFWLIIFFGLLLIFFIMYGYLNNNDK